MKLNVQEKINEIKCLEIELFETNLLRKWLKK
jgi:hypothetical protein